MGRSMNFRNKFIHHSELYEPQKPAIEKAIEEAVQETFETFGIFPRVKILETMPMRMNTSVTWSWVNLSEPFEGEFVIFMTQQLRLDIFAGIYGSIPDSISQSDLEDTQCELTNILAGRTLNIMIDGAISPIMSLPQSGSDHPDISIGEWSYLPFSVNSSWIVLFVRGQNLMKFGKLTNKNLFTKESGFHLAVATH